MTFEKAVVLFLLAAVVGWMVFTIYILDRTIAAEHRVVQQEQTINRISRERSDLLLQRDYAIRYIQEHCS